MTTASTTRRFLHPKLIALLVVSITCASSAQAGTVTTITPTGVTLNASSTFYPVGQLIDNSGLSGPPFTATSTHASSASNLNSWVTDASGADYFTAPIGPTPVMTFDLGGTFALSETNIWNYAQSNAGNQSRSITLTFSTSGITGPFSNPVNVTLPFDTTGAIDAATFNFPTIAANAVRFTITDNYAGIAPAGGDRVGLGEVKFGAFVPEPSTVLLLGLGLVGLACRRSRGRSPMAIQSMPAIVALAIGCCSLAASASAANISLDKTYAYFITPPGQTSVSPAHYRDDHTAFHGLHAVHTSGLGAFDQGLLADGNTPASVTAGLNTPLIGIYGPSGTAPATEIVFDLEGYFRVSDFVIGTVVLDGSNADAPDDVTISYSTTDLLPGSFGSAHFFDLETAYGPLADGHHDMPIAGSNILARYVKFSFDGGAMGAPNQKYMLDEITINGTSIIPEPSTVLLLGLGLVGLAARRSRRLSLPSGNKNSFVAMLLVALLTVSASIAQAAQLKVTNVTAYWKLDESVGTTVGPVVDSSAQLDGTGLYSGTLPSATDPTFGVNGAIPATGTAADFPGGSDARVNVPFNAALNPASFTLTAWARVDGGASHRSLVTSRRGSPAGTFQGYILYATPGNVWEFWTGDDPNNQWDSLVGPAVEVGEFTHLAISFDSGTNTKSLYVNGSLYASTTTHTYTPNSLNPLSIGAGGDLGADFEFNGVIDDVGFYGHALSAAEVQLVMSRGVAGAFFIPEPSSILLLGLGLVGLACRRSQRRRC